MSNVMMQAIEVIDLDRNDQDNEQWRRVVKGTCVWMNVKEGVTAFPLASCEMLDHASLPILRMCVGDALVSIPMLGVIQRVCCNCSSWLVCRHGDLACSLFHGPC